MIDVPALVPEIYVTSLSVSLPIYTDVFGFHVLAERKEEAFAYLGIEQAHLMLQEASGPGRRFGTPPQKRPYGRGINLQVRVPEVIALYGRVERATLEIVLPLEDRWYRHTSIERCNRQFVVADPDGYLLRFYQDLSSRPATGFDSYGRLERIEISRPDGPRGGRSPMASATRLPTSVHLGIVVGSPVSTSEQRCSAPDVVASQLTACR